MRRLRRVANEEVIQSIYDRIKNSGEALRDSCYVLIENLNELYKEYPEVYNEMKLVVKLPDDNFSNRILRMNEDIKDFERYVQNIDAEPPINE